MLNVYILILIYLLPNVYQDIILNHDIYFNISHILIHHLIHLTLLTFCNITNFFFMLFIHNQLDIFLALSKISIDPNTQNDYDLLILLNKHLIYHIINFLFHKILYNFSINVYYLVNIIQIHLINNNINHFYLNFHYFIM